MARHATKTGAVLAAMIAVSSALPASAQQGSSSQFQVRTLGLPLPGSGQKMIMAPYFDGGADLGTDASAHWDPTWAPSGVYASPVKGIYPVISRKNIGFYNTAEQTLTFQIEISATIQTVTLDPRELVTIPIGEASSISGTIGSGAVDLKAELLPGTLYTIRAQSGKWIFEPLSPPR
jgi:hypothetical protein